MEFKELNLTPEARERFEGFLNSIGLNIEDITHTETAPPEKDTDCGTRITGLGNIIDSCCSSGQLDTMLGGLTNVIGAVKTADISYSEESIKVDVCFKEPAGKGMSERIKSFKIEIALFPATEQKSTSAKTKQAEGHNK